MKRDDIGRSDNTSEAKTVREPSSTRNKAQNPSLNSVAYEGVLSPRPNLDRTMHG